MKFKFKVQLLITSIAIAIVILGWFTIGQANPNKEHIKIGPRDLVLGNEGDTPVGYRTILAKDNINGPDGAQPSGQGNQANGDSNAGGGLLNKLFNKVEGNPTITLAYTCVTEKLITKDLIPAFQKYWFDKTGQLVDFQIGYALPDFDTVATSVGGKLVQVLMMSSSSNTESRGYIHTKWYNTANKDVVYSIPQVFLVRKGNPLRIKTFADLTIPGVRVLHVNPLLGNGAGFWPVFAFYGSALKESEVTQGKKDYQAADEQLQKIQANSFSEMREYPPLVKLFAKGTGDVLVCVESLALNTVKTNHNVEIVVPPFTVNNDFSVTTLDRNIGTGEREVVDAFVDFLFTKEVQEMAARRGYRPSDPEVLASHPEFKELIHPFPLSYIGEQTATKKQVILEKWLTNNNNRPKYRK